ncbi:drug resistance transporter, EmrB/QacA subfamily [Mycobacteroides abscessus subsp. abscessus]|nr:drug resistance transporter, EmrB/QacA subfamily [Mycobacteroides abscessus subsp. abscessus]
MRTDSASRLLALGALSVATLTIGLDMTVLTVALPTLAMDLHADVGALQWFSTAYTLALAALMPDRPPPRVLSRHPRGS